MANATISAPTGTQAGNFVVTATFGTSVTGFDEMSLSVTAVSGNGITGITYKVMGMGSTYNIIFELPEDVEGSLSIDITGMVTPDGSSTPEAVVADAVTVMYDNITNVTATFGTPVYEENGVIRVPLTFAEAVIAPSKSIIQFRKVSGDDLSGIEYRLVGQNTAFKVAIEVPPDRNGSLELSIVGDVFKRSSGVWDNVIATPSDPISYRTIVPRIVDYDIPENFTHNEKFDVRIAFNVPVTGLHLNNVQSIFLLEGAYLGTPTPYKWVGASPPDFNTAVPDTLPADWQQLTGAPGGHIGEWHGEEGQYFLIRFGSVQETATGIFNITLKENTLRGPIGS